VRGSRKNRVFVSKYDMLDMLPERYVIELECRTMLI